MNTYDPGKVVIAWGPHIVTGFAQGAFVKVARDADAFGKYVGADGHVVRVRNRNRAGSAEIQLEQTSGSNDYFSAKAVEDELLGTGVMPLVVKDLGGRTLAAAAQAWIRKVPDIDDGQDVSARPWILDTGDLEIFVGGNA